ncbi:MAG: hypothetical protein AVDCRST_MAG15-549, partial [uncultured Rubellimicrobium sp.]
WRPAWPSSRPRSPSALSGPASRATSWTSQRSSPRCAPTTPTAKGPTPPSPSSSSPPPPTSRSRSRAMRP